MKFKVVSKSIVSLTLSATCLLLVCLLSSNQASAQEVEYDTGFLVVRKTINTRSEENNNPSVFSFSVNGGSSIYFENDGSNTLAVPSGTYTVVEDAAPGYQTDYENCTDLAITIGETAYCDIINTELSSTLNVVNILTQDDGATDQITGFSFSVNGGDSISFDDGGHSPTINLPLGEYSVIEDPAPGYMISYSESCSGVIQQSQTVTCYIYNDDLANSASVLGVSTSNTITDDAVVKVQEKEVLAKTGISQLLGAVVGMFTVVAASKISLKL